MSQYYLLTVIIMLVLYIDYKLAKKAKTTYKRVVYPHKRVIYRNVEVVNFLRRFRDSINRFLLGFRKGYSSHSVDF